MSLRFPSFSFENQSSKKERKKSTWKSIHEANLMINEPKSRLTSLMSALHLTMDHLTSRYRWFRSNLGWFACHLTTKINLTSSTSYLNVSNIIVNSTNFPSSGTTSDVGGIISASRRKNTVNDKRMDMLSDTWKDRENPCFIHLIKLLIPPDKFNVLLRW